MSVRTDTAHAMAFRLAQVQASSRLPSVVATVVRDREVVWSGSRGESVDASGSQPGPTVQYRIGSITKSMTAVLVLQCRDQGLLSLDDPVGAYLPEVPFENRTVRELLSHTSGINAEPSGEWWERKPGVDFATLAASMSADDAVLPRGRQHHYSNLGYALLGEIVARLHGDSWSQALSKRLLVPLGMSATSAHQRVPCAQGYSVHRWTGRLDPEPGHDTVAMAPAGQLWSTADDLATYASFLAAPDPEVLAPETLEEMTVPQSAEPQEGLNGAYGLGIRLQRRTGRLLYGHSGSMPGFIAALYVDREQRSGAAALANATIGAIEALTVGLLDDLAQHEPAITPVWLPEATVPGAEELTGGWFWGNTGFEISVRAGMLELAPLGGGRATRLERVTAERYRGLDGYFAGESLTLRRGDDRVVTGFELATFAFTRTPYGA